VVIGPLGFRGRPLVALFFAVAAGCFLGWTGIGLPLGIAATAAMFLIIYLVNRSKAG
jgi:hypothetical protein